MFETFSMHVSFIGLDECNINLFTKSHILNSTNIKGLIFVMFISS